MSVNNSPAYPNPSNYAGFLVLQTANRWEKFVNKKLLPHKINCSDMFHLISIFHLSRTSKELTQAQLSNFIGTTTMNTSKMLTKLEKIGLINRTIGTDVRTKTALLSPKGQTLTMELAKTMFEADQLFYPDKSKSDFVNYLQTINL